MPLFPLSVALFPFSAPLFPLSFSTQPHLPVENLVVSDCRPSSFCLLSLKAVSLAFHISLRNSWAVGCSAQDGHKLSE